MLVLGIDRKILEPEPSFSLFGSLKRLKLGSGSSYLDVCVRYKYAYVYNMPNMPINKFMLPIGSPV